MPGTGPLVQVRKPLHIPATSTGAKPKHPLKPSIPVNTATTTITLLVLFIFAPLPVSVPYPTFSLGDLCFLAEVTGFSLPLRSVCQNTTTDGPLCENALAFSSTYHSVATDALLFDTFQTPDLNRPDSILSAMLPLAKDIPTWDATDTNECPMQSFVGRYIMSVN